MNENLKKYYNVIRNMKLQDEESISAVLKKKGAYNSSKTFPLSFLHFELTSHCNAHCKHCFNDSGSHNDVNDNMTSDKWLEFTKYLIKRGGVFECLLSGGEPLLLGECLFKIMDLLNDDGSILYLITNGYFLNKEIGDRLKEYKYHWLQISIDGDSEKYHDEFRQLSGSWERAVNAAEIVANRNIPLKIAHCVTPYNLDRFDNMCSLAYSLGATCIMVGGISLSGRTAENMEYLLSNEEKMILWNKVKENRERYSGRLKIKTTNNVKEGLENHAKRPRSGAMIRANGDIRIDGMAPFVIGNILKDDFEKIWESKINTCWKDKRVLDFIAGFDENDRNFDFINFTKKDILI